MAATSGRPEVTVRPAASRIRPLSVSSALMRRNASVSVRGDELCVRHPSGRRRTLPLAAVGGVVNEHITVGSKNRNLTAGRLVVLGTDGQELDWLPGGWVQAPAPHDGTPPVDGWWSYHDVVQCFAAHNIPVGDRPSTKMTYSYGFGPWLRRPLPPAAYHWGTAWLVMLAFVAAAAVGFWAFVL